MGNLYYGSSTEPIAMSDRMLAHVQAVLATKLRRSESFTMSWQHPADPAGARSTIWIEPSIPLRFVFTSEEPETLDPVLLKELANEANSSRGLTIDASETAAVAAQRSEPRSLLHAA